MTRFSITITEHELARSGRPGDQGGFQSLPCAPSERTDDSDTPRDASLDETVSPLRD
jgi:hypothetical protein